MELDRPTILIIDDPHSNRTRHIAEALGLGTDQLHALVDQIRSVGISATEAADSFRRLEWKSLKFKRHHPIRGRWLGWAERPLGGRRQLVRNNDKRAKEAQGSGGSAVTGTWLGWAGRDLGARKQLMRKRGQGAGRARCDNVRFRTIKRTARRADK